MAKKEYLWTPESTPIIAAHSLAKHRILGEYVQTYLKVLTARPGMDKFLITLVDGFAGGGVYQDASSSQLYPGSPQILLNSVRAAEASINSTRSKPVRIDANFVFVEKNPTSLQCLKSVLLKRGDLTEKNFPTLLEGAFENYVESIITQIKSRGRAHRAIFVLDQYGYTHVSPNVLARIFSELPNAEVFLTIAAGWITPYLSNCLDVAKRLGLSQQMIDELSKNPEHDLDLSDAGRRPDLLAVQRILHHIFTSVVLSRFYTPFFIISRESNRPIWFLHIANNERAHDVVKTLHWQFENHFEHFGGSGLKMLGYDPNADPAVTGQFKFKFDSDAKNETVSSLIQELPRRVSENYSTGIEFNQLFQNLCNETPANKELMGKAISKLCSEGELEKIGSKGEQREPATMPHDDDFVRIPVQTSFSIPE